MYDELRSSKNRHYYNMGCLKEKHFNLTIHNIFMFRTIGAVLLTLGALFMVMGMWSGKVSNSMFLFQILAGPIFIYYGLQLLK
jgi:hypothetical protein